MKLLRTLLFLIALAAPAARADVPQQQIAAAAAHIDALFAAHWKSHGLAPNDPVSDETFVRRVYLDLAGRIPTAQEAVAYLDSKQPGKRAALIASLLRQESYVSHFYNYWADVLRYKSHAVNRANVVEAAYAKYLKESLRTNKPYNQFVRELLAARGYAWENGAIGYYHRDPDMPLDNMAITARIFLGTRIECAQCHDHPFDKWKQTDFFHLAAYTHANKSLNEAFDGQSAAMRAKEKAIDELFQKERAASADGGKEAAERRKERLAALDNRGVAGIVKGPVGQLLSPVGLYRDQKSVLKLPHDFHQADGKPGDPMKPKPVMGAAPEVAPGQDPAEVFANWLTSPDNPRFTRVIVNRLWKKMFGAPLTEAADDLRDDSKATVPEVEDYLVKLMVALKYDMRAFLSVLANTRAYQSAVSREEFTPGTAYRFPGPLLRRMTAEQIWDSLVALANYEPDARDLEKETREERRINISRMALDAYVNYDGEKLLNLALDRLAAERELTKRMTAIGEAMVAAKREGDSVRMRELRKQDDQLVIERAQSGVKEIIMPMLTNLAQKKAGKDAVPSVDPNYRINANPRVLGPETWRRMYIPGYGPPPKTAAQLEAEAQAKKQRIAACAARLGIAEKDQAAFAVYWEKSRAEWMRASELDSPAPRGHFLRTMGQSDREFVENANPNAAIPQALLLMNSELISSQGLLSPWSPMMQFVAAAGAPDRKMEAAYLALLSRKPAPAETTAWMKASSQGLQSIEDLIYALLNTKQFLFIQ